MVNPATEIVITATAVTAPAKRSIRAVDATPDPCVRIARDSRQQDECGNRADTSQNPISTHRFCLHRKLGDHQRIEADPGKPPNINRRIGSGMFLGPNLGSRTAWPSFQATDRPFVKSGKLR